MLVDYCWKVQTGYQKGYSFSKPHCIAYSWIGYQEAYLYTDYPSVLWYTANLLSVTDSVEDEENEIEYRLAGLYFMIQDTKKAKFHLSNGLRLNFDNYIILEDLFPVVWTRKMVQNYIAKHKK